MLHGCDWKQPFLRLELRGPDQQLLWWSEWPIYADQQAEHLLDGCLLAMLNEKLADMRKRIEAKV